MYKNQSLGLAQPEPFMLNRRSVQSYEKGIIRRPLSSPSTMDGFQ